MIDSKIEVFTCAVFGQTKPYHMTCCFEKHVPTVTVQPLELRLVVVRESYGYFEIDGSLVGWGWRERV